jgi:hypothetical protein
MFVVDEDSSDERLVRAAELLERCTGVVVLKGIATLRPSPYEIECAVAVSMPGYARCEEEYRVMAENAARALDSSRLRRLMPDRPLRWTVLEDDGQSPVELWRSP